MQQELQRIRNNDYSAIDQKLYNNINMTSDLDNTIAQLAQLQKYLKSQIDNIQDQGEKQAALRASKVVLSMSCVNNQSQVIRKCQCYHAFVQIHEKIKKVKKNFKNFREKIERQMKDCINDIAEQMTQNFTHMSGLLNRKSSQNTKTKSQLYICQQQIHDLKQKNQQLNSKLQQWQQAVKKRKQKIKSVKDQKSTISLYTNTENHLTYRQSNQQFFQSYTSELQKNQARFSKHKTDRDIIACVYTENDRYRQSQNSTPRLPMPLRRESAGKQYGSSLERYSSCANMNQRQKMKIYEQANRISTAKNSPTKIKFTHTNQELVNQKTGVNREKQNEILKIKGTTQQANRRPKKLKLFSII